MSSVSVPPHCQSCGWLYSKMGACLPQGVSPIYSYISFLPYLLIIVFGLLVLFARRRKQIQMLVLLVTAYVIADRIVKNLIMHQRPEGACKKTFGFPSSHMVVICCYAFQMMPQCRVSQRIFLAILIVTQALARVNLGYHCWYQVIGGVVFALIYTFVFNK